MRFQSIFATALLVQTALSAAAAGIQGGTANAQAAAGNTYADNGKHCTQDQDCHAGGCCVWQTIMSSGQNKPSTKVKATCRANAGQSQPCSKKSWHNKGLGKGQDGYMAACPCNGDYLICVPHQYDPKLADYRCEAYG